MKELIMALALMIVFTISVIFQSEYHIHQEQRLFLKSVSEEAAASAAQYFDWEKYGDGYLVFNEQQARLALEETLRSSLRLNSDLSPSSSSYWKGIDKVTYDVVFIGSSEYEQIKTNQNSVYQYNHEKGTTDLMIFGPSVIVKVYTGPAKYTLLDMNGNENYEIAMYTFEE